MVKVNVDAASLKVDVDITTLLDVVKPLQETFVAAMENAMAAQAQELKNVQTLYEAGLAATKYQVEGASRMAELLAEQAQKQREAFESMLEYALQAYTAALRTSLSPDEKHERVVAPVGPQGELGEVDQAGPAHNRSRSTRASRLQRTR